MEKIYALVDYKGHFGEKRYSIPYRSGMDTSLIKKYFAENGFEIQYLHLCDVDLRNVDFKGQYVIYTSSESVRGYYKSYIEDICYALHLHGAILIPHFKYLRAHHNKVFMELLRDMADLGGIQSIKSWHFGTLEELKRKIKSLNDKSVIKATAGAKSKNVFLGESHSEIMCHAQCVSGSNNIIGELWDIGRSLKHKGYIRDSLYQNKFVAQNFIEKLNNDWKVLVYGEKYYVMRRRTRKNDFRASGSGRFDFKETLPDGLLDFSKRVYDYFNVPNISLDIAFDGKTFHLFEFQMINFGTITIEKAPCYFSQRDSGWSLQKIKSVVEQEYVTSIVAYIRRNYKI